jgi:hypothetical protein
MLTRISGAPATGENPASCPHQAPVAVTVAVAVGRVRSLATLGRADEFDLAGRDP